MCGFVVRVISSSLTPQGGSLAQVNDASAGERTQFFRQGMRRGTGHSSEYRMLQVFRIARSLAASQAAK
jgi:hypothetical protein